MLAFLFMPCGDCGLIFFLTTPWPLQSDHVLWSTCAMNKCFRTLKKALFESTVFPCTYTDTIEQWEGKKGKFSPVKLSWGMFPFSSLLSFHCLLQQWGSESPAKVASARLLFQTPDANMWRHLAHWQASQTVVLAALEPVMWLILLLGTLILWECCPNQGNKERSGLGWGELHALKMQVTW